MLHSGCILPGIVDCFTQPVPSAHSPSLLPCLAKLFISGVVVCTTAGEAVCINGK